MITFWSVSLSLSFDFNYALLGEMGCKTGRSGIRELKDEGTEVGSGAGGSAGVQKSSIVQMFVVFRYRDMVAVGRDGGNAGDGSIPNLHRWPTENRNPPDTGRR